LADSAVVTASQLIFREAQMMTPATKRGAPPHITTISLYAVRVSSGNAFAGSNVSANSNGDL